LDFQQHIRFSKCSPGFAADGFAPRNLVRVLVRPVSPDVFVPVRGARTAPDSELALMPHYGFVYEG
jgi:hypothetical protein